MTPMQHAWLKAMALFLTKAAIKALHTLANSPLVTPVEAAAVVLAEHALEALETVEEPAPAPGNPS